MRALTLSPLTVLPCSPIEQIDAALAAGFDSVGLRLFPTLPTDLDVMGNPALKREIEKRLLETGIRVLDIEVVRITPDMSFDAIEPVLEFAAKLGARWLAATSLAAEDYSGHDEPFIVERLAQVGELTSRYAMGVTLEFMAFRGVKTIGDAARIVKAADSPNVGITLDALHFFRSGGTLTQLNAVDPSKFACIQLSDGPAAAPVDLIGEARKDRLYPGEGQLPLGPLLTALPHTLPVSVEVPSSVRAHMSAMERAQEGAKWSRQLLASIAPQTSTA